MLDHLRSSGHACKYPPGHLLSVGILNSVMSAMSFISIIFSAPLAFLLRNTAEGKKRVSSTSSLSIKCGRDIING